MGQPVWLVSEQEPSQRMLEYTRKRLRGEKAPSLYEFKGTRKDQTTVDLEASVSTAKIGANTCIISLCCDITELKQLENTLRQKRAFLSTLIDHLPISVLQNIKSPHKLFSTLP